MFFLLKYTGILSLPLFSLIAFGLLQKAHGHSYKNNSISETILFLEHSKLRLLFRLNFLLKAFLDLCFTWYIMVALHLSIRSPIVLGIGIASLLFGSLAYYIVGRTKRIHIALVYTVGVLWAICMLLLAYRLRVPWFIVYTWFIAIIPTAIAFWYLYLNKVTVVVQLVCMVMIYSWLVVFVTKFL